MLYSSDFNGGAQSGTIVADKGAKATASSASQGTIDQVRGEPSSAIGMEGNFSAAKAGASAQLMLPAIAVQNSERNLSRLTVGFDLWVSQLHAVRLMVRSLDAKNKVTGTRSVRVVPPVAGAFYRFTIDLDKTQVVSGQFDPTAPKIQFGWELTDADGPVSRSSQTSLRIDNLSYSTPTYYVSPTGNDNNDGRTEKSAFASLQKAVNSAQPGDTIGVLTGNYTSAPGQTLVNINKAGEPARWITLRGLPGQTPVLNSDGWNVIALNQDSAYIEIRGLTVRGNRSRLTIEQAEQNSASVKGADGKPVPPNPLYNTNGIGVDARQGTEAKRAHHIRIIDNLVYENAGGGISAINSDYNTIEGNRVFDNCHLMRYGGSGISVFRSWNSDQNTGYKNFVIGNISAGNRTYIPWGEIGRISDGNGIIIDDLINHQSGASQIAYEGRTLVQNNLSYNNGGSGIHAYASNHVDIINNTAYHNAQSPELNWRQIFIGGDCKDGNVRNNILWAQKGKPLNFEKSYRSSEISYDFNLCFGDGDNSVASSGGLGAQSAKDTIKGTGNVYAQPLFVRPSTDPKTADFHLRVGSPGVDAGAPGVGVPIIDLDHKSRPVGKATDMGAYELTP